MAGMRFVLADLAGSSLGEPRAFERQLSVGVSRLATASFRLRAEDQLWDSAKAGAAMLKVFDSGGGLRFYGPIVGDEEVGEGQGAKVRVSAADLAWRLGKRYVGRDASGIGTTYTSVDAGIIAFNVLAAVNADEATGISQGAQDTFGARTVTYLWKRALDALSELGGVDSSYEWALRYVDGTPPTVYLDLGTKLGQDRTTSVFLEYGTGKTNCRGYARARTIDQLATHVWALGSGSTQVSSAFSLTAATSYKRHEDVVSYGGDLTVSALLDAFASKQLAARSSPRQIITLMPFAKAAPKYGVDYFLGDTVSARVLVHGSARVNGPARIWGADIAIDELGNEQPTLHLAPDS